MRTVEYNKYKEHILKYTEAEDIRETIEQLKKQKNCTTTWEAARRMVEGGCFVWNYWQVLDVFKEVYGEEYKHETYETKKGDLHVKNGEVYCWTTYKAKIAKTIELMERKGEL